MKVWIRYLQHGSVCMETDAEFKILSEAQQVSICKDYLDSIADYELVNGLSDYILEEDEISKDIRFFDETPDVEAIEIDEIEEILYESKRYTEYWN